MARINLMPWREKRRQERQKAFVGMLGLMAAVAVGIVVIGWTVQMGQVDKQESRNKRLQTEIKVMDDKVAQIQDLDIKRDRLLGRKSVIEDLQSNRSQMVHLFDELAHTLPDGVQLSSIQQKNGFLEITGLAESNSRVSDYLRRLSGSSWLSKPDLSIIEVRAPMSNPKAASSAQTAKDDNATLLPYDFKIKLSLVNPNKASDDGDDDTSGKGAGSKIRSKVKSPSTASSDKRPSSGQLSPSVAASSPAPAPSIALPAPAAVHAPDGIPAASQPSPAVSAGSALPAAPVAPTSVTPGHGLPSAPSLSPPPSSLEAAPVGAPALTPAAPVVVPPIEPVPSVRSSESAAPSASQGT